MAAVSTMQPSRPDCSSVPLSSNLHLNIFQRGLAIPELDFKDNRYPTLTLDNGFRKSSPMVIASTDTTPWGAAEPKQPSTRSEVVSQEPQEQSHLAQPHPDGIPGSLPQGAAQPVVERYSLNDNPQASSNGALTDSRLFRSTGDSFATSPSPPPQLPRDIPTSLKPANHRQSSHPPLDPAGSSRLSYPNDPSGLSTSRPYSPTMGIVIPISPNPRAYAQHPTYINPVAAAPDPINPILSPNPPTPPEEICVECAMRDQDMADVIVVGPGIWDRESDVLYEELLCRELEEEEAGVISSECSSKPRARGGRLTEQNLKVWHTMVREFSATDYHDTHYSN